MNGTGGDRNGSPATPSDDRDEKTACRKSATRRKSATCRKQRGTAEREPARVFSTAGNGRAGRRRRARNPFTGVPGFDESYCAKNDDDDDDDDGDDETLSSVAKVSLCRAYMHSVFPSVFPAPILYQGWIKPARSASGEHKTGNTLVPVGRCSTFPDGIFVQTVPGRQVTEIRFPRSGQTFKSQ